LVIASFDTKRVFVMPSLIPFEIEFLFLLEICQDSTEFQCQLQVKTMCHTSFCIFGQINKAVWFADLVNMAKQVKNVTNHMNHI
jgi:hypothetical protein